MIGDRTVTIFYDEVMLQHDPKVDLPFIPSRVEKRVRNLLGTLDFKWSYPEHPGRLTAILDLLEKEPVPGTSFRAGPSATYEQLGRVHTSGYLDDIFSLDGKAAWLDRDTTAVSEGSIKAATAAAGQAIAAVECVVKGEAQSAFALVRPPGHHAEPVRARGFCLFNNVAVAAAHAQAKLGCERILIIDWDAHHGNGTQEIFWADPDVLFFDIHGAAPFYPGSGDLDEVGAGFGEGYTVNVPIPENSGDIAFEKAFREILIPAAERFKPDLVLVSAGFDPHRNDLALNLSYDGFAAITGIVQQIADQHCGGKLALVLEGGYNLTSLAKGTRTVLEVLAGGDIPTLYECGVKAVNEAAEFHRDAFTDD
ncbi:histone deacetylase family protein [Halopseudomonas salegens]|uniref:Acetoin utilization deacetylase AcuC n=1 Tax=Halopseudomonas salegens TaxID=1434072 RepID=A0A1H2G8T0_9GAMM|nr:histone deacetylase [Halopseudomonas salegens]SDU15881.1 Acetoin utilization deacetylase AcuC [Halopseudomonas salegens]